MTDEEIERAALEDYKCKIGRGYAIEDVAWKHGCDFGHKAGREKMIRIAWLVAEEDGGCCTNGDRFVAKLKQKLLENGL